MSRARAELREFILRNLYDAHFVEDQTTPYMPKYGQIFRSESITGRETQVNTGLLNVNFKERIDKEPVHYVDPTSGRKHVGKINIFDAGVRIPRRLTESDSQRPALTNFLGNWQSAAMNRFRLDLEKYFFDLVNKAGYTAGDPIYNNTNEIFDDPGGDLGFDGKPILALSGNDHAFLKKPAEVATNAFYNSLGATGKPLNTDNFDDAYERIKYFNNFNDAGERISCTPNLLLVPPSLRADAMQIVKTSTGTPGDVNNSFNHNFELVDVLISEFLTDASAWYLFDTAQGMWKAFDQEAPRFDTEYDFDHDCWKAKMQVAYGHMIMSWNNVAGGNIPTS